MSTSLIDKAWNWPHVEDIPSFWKDPPPSMALATPRALRIAVFRENKVHVSIFHLFRILPLHFDLVEVQNRMHTGTLVYIFKISNSYLCKIYGYSAPSRADKSDTSESLTGCAVMST